MQGSKFLIFLVNLAKKGHIDPTRG